MDGRHNMGRSLTTDDTQLPVMSVDTDNDAAVDITSDWTTLTTLVNEVGSFCWSFMRIANPTVENYDFKLTIDDVVVWDYTFAVLGDFNLMGANANESPLFSCKRNVKFEAKSTTDVSTTLTMDLRPIK